MGTAALVTHFAPRWPAWQLQPTAGGVGPVTFPSSKLIILVEIFIGGQWVDVSPYVLYERYIRISRGRRANQRRPQTAQCALTFRNDDKRFSPRNVNGAYAGLLRQNTPIRVSVNPGSGLVRRFTGKIPDWNPVARGHPNDRDVSIVAVGRRGQLDRGNANTPTKSAPRRFIPNTSFCWAYWSLEAGAFADEPGLPDIGLYAMRPVTGFHPSGALIGYPQWGAGQLAPWLPPVLSRSGTAGLTAVWAPVEMTFNTSWTIGFGYNSGTDAGTSAVDVNPSYLGGALGWPQLTLDPANQQVLTALNGEPEAVAGAPIFDGLPHYVSWTVSQFGGDGLSEVWIDDVQYISEVTIGAFTVPAVRQLGLVADAQSGSGIAQGHVSVHSPGFSSPTLFDTLLGHRGELATDRFARLCTEEGISYVVNELIVDSQVMGPQKTSRIIDLLDECADVNEGIFDEDINNKARLTSRTYRYNRAPALSIDYSTGAILPPFAPLDDTTFARNDWTLTRDEGNPQRYEKTSGPLNVNEPETDDQGITRLDDSDQIVTNTDASSLQHAGYRVFRDTIDEPRFDQVSFSLLKNPELIAGWLASDTGSRVLITNPPADAGPYTLDVALEGYDEDFNQADWSVSAYFEPSAISKVARYDVDRYDCNGSTLNEALDTSETGVDIIISDQCVWAHDNGDFYVRVGVEEMKVTAVSAAAGSLGAYTQTMTVERGANGTPAATHDVGDQVHIKPPARYAL